MLHAHLVVPVLIERIWFNNLSERETLRKKKEQGRNCRGRTRKLDQFLNWSIAPKLAASVTAIVTLVTKGRSCYSSISSVVDEGEWAGSCPGPFSQGVGGTHGGHLKEGRFGRRAGVGCLERRRVFFELLWRHIWSNVILGPSRNLTRYVDHFCVECFLS